MDTHSTRWHGILTHCTRRILFGCICIVACAISPLLALWQANDPHLQTAVMFLAAQNGNVAAMDKILRGGLDVDCCDDTGITPLMAAASAGKLAAVRKLLAAGARINFCAEVYGTPLMLATINGHHDVMRELIERGADVNAGNPTGQTALWYARISGDGETLRILIVAGAVAEGHPTAPSEPEEIERGGDIRTPSETRATNCTLGSASVRRRVGAASARRRNTSRSCLEPLENRRLLSGYLQANLAADQPGTALVPASTGDSFRF